VVGASATTHETDCPGGTRLPAAGSDEITRPAGTVVLLRGDRVPGVSPASSSSEIASLSVSSVMSGTTTTRGCRATRTVTVPPTGSNSPGSGIWLRTVPGSASVVVTRTTVSRSSNLRTSAPACTSDTPVTSGTWTDGGTGVGGGGGVGGGVGAGVGTNGRCGGVTVLASNLVTCPGRVCNSPRNDPWAPVRGDSSTW
jgi:hypothetical protein